VFHMRYELGFYISEDDILQFSTEVARGMVSCGSGNVSEEWVRHSWSMGLKGSARAEDILLWSSFQAPGPLNIL
jgi:hypothetical protein